MKLSRVEYFKMEIQQFESAIAQLDRYRIDIKGIDKIIDKGKDFYLKKIAATKNMIEQYSNDILQKINSLEGIDREVLYLRYVERKKWFDIELDTNWSGRQLHRIHKRALEKLIEMYGEGIKDEITNAS